MNAELVNTCPSCGAQESLDVLLERMMAEPAQRQLLALVIQRSMPIGAKLVRYLRLHKPAKQALSAPKLKHLLDELITAVCIGTFEHKGPRLLSPVEAWDDVFEAVFDAADKGTLKTPLNGNAYLFGIAMRKAEETMAAQEKSEEAERRRHRSAHTSAAATDIAALMQQPAQASTGHNKVAESRPLAPAPGQSPLVRKMKAEMEAKKQRSITATTSQGVTT